MGTGEFNALNQGRGASRNPPSLFNSATEARGFIKGQAPGKLNGREDDFARLV